MNRKMNRGHGRTSVNRTDRNIDKLVTKTSIRAYDTEHEKRNKTTAHGTRTSKSQRKTKKNSKSTNYPFVAHSCSVPAITAVAAMRGFAVAASLLFSLLRLRLPLASCRAISGLATWGYLCPLAEPRSAILMSHLQYQ